MMFLLTLFFSWIFLPGEASRRHASHQELLQLLPVSPACSVCNPECIAVTLFNHVHDLRRFRRPVKPIRLDIPLLVPQWGRFRITAAGAH